MNRKRTLAIAPGAVTVPEPASDFHLIHNKIPYALSLTGARAGTDLSPVLRPVLFRAPAEGPAFGARLCEPQRARTEVGK